jgi:hypothetical protein
VALGGSLLTLGLSARWGETFPRWLPMIGDRRVPPMLAVLPAGVISILAFNAGLAFWRDSVQRYLRGEPWYPIDVIGQLWPIWGISLALATIAYYGRRRGRCNMCGR